MIPDLFKKIEILLLDVDGVLTDGSLFIDNHGNEIKKFNSKDGFGLRMLMDAGIKVGIITGRKSNSLSARCKNLGIEILYDGSLDKRSALQDIAITTNIQLKHMAYMGDDIPDIQVFNRVGLSIAVNDALDIVRKKADYITKKPGGRGAVREICDMILKARNQWDQSIKKYIV